MKRRFTMIEVLVVLVIMLLVLGVVMPRVLRIPKRLQVEGARTKILSALRECSVRSVASGRMVRVALDPSGRFLLVTSVPLERSVLSDSKLPNEGAAPTDSSGLVVPTRSRYKIPQQVAWEMEEWTVGEDGEDSPAFLFHPDGGACGPDLVFEVAKRRFLLRVDRLTGRAEIEELEE